MPGGSSRTELEKVQLDPYKNGLQPKSDCLQPTSNGLQPKHPHQLPAPNTWTRLKKGSNDDRTISCLYERVGHRSLDPTDRLESWGPSNQPRLIGSHLADPTMSWRWGLDPTSGHPPTKHQMSPPWLSQYAMHDIHWQMWPEKSFSKDPCWRKYGRAIWRWRMLVICSCFWPKCRGARTS